MVTRSDVARHVGVSDAVVSYVLNNKSFVKEETRMKVLQAIEELGYQPNHTARSLKTKKSFQLAVLTNYIGNPFEAGLLLHLEAAARNHGYMITYQSYCDGREDELKILLAGRVDGIVLLGQSLDAGTREFFLKRNVPMVSVMKQVQGDVVSVDMDWEAAYLQIIRELVRLGHRHIAFMSHSNLLDPLCCRLEGFMRAMQSDETFRSMDCTFLTGGGRYETAYQMVMELAEAPEFTAVLCANDLMAIGVNAACRSRGWNVPDRLSIIGSENILMVSETHPPIAALVYPRSEAAYAAIDILMQLIAGHSVNSKVLTADFVERPSLAGAAKHS
ncbi:LacI family DNA-binding transcriptional regulator [Paenibacillus aceris]|uniref:DNA-binding LacI/PurR family transcriptional regulator n=1 Tax=Paenibacillus aceris TaxID=869555 RepID=A0ABS4I8J9_9BACL|nr:LacI family DNA-binding transcriptional regulator [Paenibacillus aceris]MBP1967264.1 DNA-binding LacI/PurR family transcriptional regulator [Paenibacillus aceris]NHW33554.1 LacI family transcriptional regulator [Paenibacillus aceris]